MDGITLGRDQIFTGWKEEESSKVVGVVETVYEEGEEAFPIKKLRELITQYHTSEAQEPYFYSVRKICPVDIARKIQLRKRLYFSLTILTCAAVSAIIFLKTSSYFANVWKACQDIAATKKYVMKRFGFFDRYATAEDIWFHHSPVNGASLLLILRNAFCFFVCPVLGWAFLNQETYKKIYADLIVDRSKDTRVCPSNFDIEKDNDPLTQEKISIQKLCSPQMIYLPNYVTEAKSFVIALLLAGNKNFSDPVYRREFSEEERKNILSQIERIFLISEEKFNACFENDNSHEQLLDYLHPDRFLRDARVVNATGQFSTAAMQNLQEVLGERPESINFAVDRFVSEIPDEQQRNMLRRAVRINLLISTGYMNNLRADDRTRVRIQRFENLTGISLLT